MRRLLWISVNLFVAIIVMVPLTFAAYGYFVAVISRGWLSLLGGAVGLVVAYGLCGLLFSLVPGLMEKYSSGSLAEGSSDDVMIRATYIMPSLFFGVILLGFTLFSGHFSFLIDAFVFMVLSNVAMAAGLWHLRLRQWLPGASAE